MDQTLYRVAFKEREEIKRTTMQKIARRHNKEGGKRLEQESNRQKTMEGIDGGLHPAEDGQSLGEGEGKGFNHDCQIVSVVCGCSTILAKRQWACCQRILACCLLFVCCLTSQQHASVSQGRMCLDNFTCCHAEIEVADQTFHLIQSQYTDIGPTSPSTDQIIPGAWQGSHWSAIF